jgi:hypothetical protein
MVTSSVRPEVPKRQHIALGYKDGPRARAKLAELGGLWSDVRLLPAPKGPDGLCSRPLLFWDSTLHVPWLRSCGSGKSASCPSCAATRKRRVRRVAHLGVLDRLASGGFLGLLTLTAPGDPGHLRWSLDGPRGHRPVCGCEHSAPHGPGVWNRDAARRWDRLNRSLKRAFPGAQFYRAVEPQQRGLLHLHVILWSPTPIDVRVLQDLALRAGFGCNTRLDMCRGQEDGARFANYVTKYVTKGIDGRHELPWEQIDTDTGELTSSVATYRPWSQSAGFGVRMRTHLDAIAAERRRAALRLAAAEPLLADVLGATLIDESGTAAQPPP